jgi:ABC-type phosphate transport system substrate-binding protein
MNNYAKRSTMALVTLLSLSITPAAAAGDKKVVAVCNPNNSISSISAQTLQNIYLGRMTHWDNGRKIKALMRPASAPAGKAFLKAILGISETRYKQHWAKLEFSGKGMAPKKLLSPIDVATFVQAMKGSIGFMLESELPKIGRRRVRQLNITR